MENHNDTCYIYDLQPFTICETAHSQTPVTYIFLSSDDEKYTVYTNEQNGFIMTAKKSSISKRIKVKSLFTPQGEYKTLAEVEYLDKVHKEIKEKALDYLRENKRKLKPQARAIQNAIEAN